MKNIKKVFYTLLAASLLAFPITLSVSAPALASEATGVHSKLVAHSTWHSSVPASAEGFTDITEFSSGQEVPYVGGQKDVDSAAPFIRDHAKIFSPENYPKWEKQLRALATKYGIAPYVVTVNSFQHSSPEQWGANYYAANQLGLNQKTADGVIMVINPTTRDLWFLGHGKGEEAFTPYGIDKLYDHVKKPLGDDDWDEGFQVYLREISDYLQQWKAGTPYSKDHPIPHRMTLKSTLAGAGGAAGIGVISGLSIMGSLKRKHHSAQLQAGAANYIVPGSNQITGSNEVFVRSYTTQVAIPKSDDSSSSSGSYSSGGTSYSSGGGKF